MSRLFLAVLGLPVFMAGCAAVPAREPVLPEPRSLLSNSAECEALWAEGIQEAKIEFEPRPYGWAIARYDVEKGAVVRVEILDGSPRKVVEAPTIAHLQGRRFLSQGSARGCLTKHHWG